MFCSIDYRPDAWKHVMPCACLILWAGIKVWATELSDNRRYAAFSARLLWIVHGEPLLWLVVKNRGYVNIKRSPSCACCDTFMSHETRSWLFYRTASPLAVLSCNTTLSAIKLLRTILHGNSFTIGCFNWYQRCSCKLLRSVPVWYKELFWSSIAWYHIIVP